MIITADAGIKPILIEGGDAQSPIWGRAKLVIVFLMGVKAVLVDVGWRALFRMILADAAFLMR